MTLSDFRSDWGFRPTVPFETAEEDALGIDDLLSRSGDDLGLEVDATGHLVLVEGRDFD